MGDCEDLDELIQQAFDKHMLNRLPDLLEKHLPAVDKLIAERINGDYTPELNGHFHDRVEAIVETTVGNYLRVGRSIIDAAIFRYLDKKLEDHFEQDVKWRVNRLMEKLKKSFDEALGKV